MKFIRIYPFSRYTVVLIKIVTNRFDSCENFYQEGPIYNSVNVTKLKTKNFILTYIYVIKQLNKSQPQLNRVISTYYK